LKLKIATRLKFGPIFCMVGYSQARCPIFFYYN